MQHSLRYYRHSGLVIYMSKLPAPSVSMPCDYRILQAPQKNKFYLSFGETAQRSHLIDRGVTKLAFSDSYQSAVTDNFDLPNCISNLSPETIEAPEVISLPDWRTTAKPLLRILSGCARRKLCSRADNSVS